MKNKFSYILKVNYVANSILLGQTNIINLVQLFKSGKWAFTIGVVHVRGCWVQYVVPTSMAPNSHIRPKREEFNLKMNNCY